MFDNVHGCGMAPHAFSPRRPALGCQSTAAPQHSHTATCSALALPLAPHAQKETTQKLCANVKHWCVKQCMSCLDAHFAQVFVIGGSYSGGTGDKTGEVYSSADNTWKLLPGADVAPILTNDLQGIYRADNHAWLWVSLLATHACKCTSLCAPHVISRTVKLLHSSFQGADDDRVFFTASRHAAPSLCSC